MIRRLAASAAALLMLSACGADDAQQEAVEPTAASTATTASESASQTPSTTLAATPTPQTKPRPLRKGERRVTLAMPEVYTPAAPNGVGTDDYRCFVLDPKLKKDAYLTGTQIIPGNPEVVHHVIIFEAPKESDAYIKQLDDAEDGPGWTCFGQTNFGQDAVDGLNDAPWLGAWAPGGKESVNAPGFGRKLEKGSRIVLQVHYNLLKGAQPDISAIQLRLAPGNTPNMTPLHTMLLPGPVELPCRAGKDKGPLCDREAAMADVKERFGGPEGSTNDLLYVLCGGKPKASETTSCVRPVLEPMTIRAAAGHMHLLGRSIKIEVNPGTPQARTVLDIPVWDFDDQGSRVIEPITVQPYETVKVTCRHAQWLRDRLPAFDHQRDDRYVVWGEGTTDEMCLGILTVTRP